VDAGALVVSVDPPVSPTFQSSVILRGRLAEGTGSAPPTPPPFVASLSVAQARLGDTLDITVSAVNTTFVAGQTQAAFGAGVTVQQITVQSPTSLVLRVHVDPRAELGPRLLALSTGRQEAILPHALSIVAGLGTFTGRLVTVAGAPIPQGSVCVPSTTVCTSVTTNGTFTLGNVPSTAGRLVAAATGYQNGSAIGSIGPGATASVGDIVLEEALELPPPPPPNTPAIAPRLALTIARMFIAQADPLSMTPERARQTVIDSILLVGADELGVTDAEGRQLNPDVAGAGIMSLDDRGVSLQARGLVQGATQSLEELGFALAMMFEWSNGAPTPDDLVTILQQSVNAAWAAPTLEDSQLAILLFNRGATLSPLPPRLSRQTRVNSMQAFLILSGAMLNGYHAQRPGGTAQLEPAPVEAAPRGLWARLRSSVASVAAAIDPRSAAFGASRASVTTRLPQATAPTPFERRRTRLLDGLETRRLEQGQPPTHRVRQLSKMFSEFRAGFARSVVQNLVGAALFSFLPAMAAPGGLGAVTIMAAVVGSFTDVFLFAGFIPLIAQLAPPPPIINSVRQVGNRIVVRIERIEKDRRCRALYATDAEAQKGLCNFQYTLYRHVRQTNAPSGPTSPEYKPRVVRARYVPKYSEDVATGVFEIEDAFPQPGINWYFADVIHKIPLQIPDSLGFAAGTMSIPTRIAIPVGNIISLFFLTELVSDFSEPNPIPALNFNNHTGDDWDRVRVMFTPAPPTSTFQALRSDALGRVFGNDTGFRQFSQHAPGQNVPLLRPGFGLGTGLDMDSRGFLYSINEQSQGQFGGRVFRIGSDGSQSLVGTVNKYSAFLGTGNPSNAVALTVGPGNGGRAFVDGDLFVADNADRTIKRLPTSIIPAAGIGAMPAPGHGIFGSAAAVPIVGYPFVQFPSCTGPSEPIRDLLFDRTKENLYTLIGSELYRIPIDGQSGAAGPTSVSATLDGMQAGGGAVRIKVRGSAREQVGAALKSQLILNADVTGAPCAGHFQWRTSDSRVADMVERTNGAGTSTLRLRALQPGVATITVEYLAAGRTTPIQDTIQVTVYETGPILFVHGWIGQGSNWENDLAQLANTYGLNRGGSLCASWVRNRGRWARVLMSNETLRNGNGEQYVCDEAAVDGSVFTLNFDDNQNNFIETAGELSDIVNQIVRRIGGDECIALPGETTPLPESCPKLTLVAHSMGGQTSRAFIQSVRHSGFSVRDRTLPTDTGLSLPMPFYPHVGQVAKLVQIGTMNLGTPAPLLNQDETLLFFGASNFVSSASRSFGVPVDPFSSAIESMGVQSTALLRLQAEHLDQLRAIELVSIVTQINPGVAANVCGLIDAGSMTGQQLVARLPAAVRLALTVIAAVAGRTLEDWISDPLRRVHERLCGEGNPNITIPVFGAQGLGQPFLYNSDEIVGVDSQNLNNLFRFVDQGPSGIVRLCRNETPGQSGAVAKVVCYTDVQHHEDTARPELVVPELDLGGGLGTPPSPPNPTPDSGGSTTQETLPAVAFLSNPSYLATDAANNLFVADRSGSVTIIRPGGSNGQPGTATTFLNGLTGLGPIAVEGAHLYAVRNGDVLRISLGISGRIVEASGVPVRNATVLVQAAGGAQQRTVTTDGDGNFSVPLDSLDTTVTQDQLVLFVTITTAGSSTEPSRTVQQNVALAVNDPVLRERTQTVVTITLPAVQ
jgi:hypothetical protein